MSFYYESRGPMTNRTEAITDVATKVSITSGKEYMTIQNIGGTVCYLGGSGVTDSTGYRLYPNAAYDFQKCNGKTFNFYAVCAAAGSTTLGVYEW